MCCGSARQQSLVHGETNTTNTPEPCQPRWAEGGAGTPCPGPSLQATSQETLRGRDAASMGGDFGECPQLSAELGFLSDGRNPRGWQSPIAAGRCLRLRRTVEPLTPEGSTATGWPRAPPLPAGWRGHPAARPLLCEPGAARSEGKLFQCPSGPGWAGGGCHHSVM